MLEPPVSRHHNRITVYYFKHGHEFLLLLLLKLRFPCSTTAPSPMHHDVNSCLSAKSVVPLRGTIQLTIIYGGFHTVGCSAGSFVHFFWLPDSWGLYIHRLL